jgi:transposase-like protein
MMTKTRRNYTEEFKIKAVRLYGRSSKMQEDVEEKIGIGSGCLSRWKKKYREDEDTDTIQEQEAQATRIRQLERRMRSCVKNERFYKKQSPSSRNQSDEIRVHRGSSG